MNLVSDGGRTTAVPLHTNLLQNFAMVFSADALNR
jgi:hypothetical protein